MAGFVPQQFFNYSWNSGAHEISSKKLISMLAFGLKTLFVDYIKLSVKTCGIKIYAMIYQGFQAQEKRP